MPSAAERVREDGTWVVGKSALADIEAQLIEANGSTITRTEANESRTNPLMMAMMMKMMMMTMMMII